MTEQVDVENLRMCLRGALARSGTADTVTVPAFYIRDALAALPPTGVEVTRSDKETHVLRDLVKRLRNWVPGSAFSKKLVNEGADALEYLLDSAR